MVSGHIFHYRKNSWPAEEYVGRTALQLVSQPTFGSCVCVARSRIRFVSRVPSVCLLMV